VEKGTMKLHLHIALAIIMMGNEVLIQRRPSSADHLPDVWEFPGGKVEAHETPANAAIREAREEVGLNIEILRVLTPIDWDYAERSVTLYPFEARVVAGKAVGARWVARQELDAADFPDANRALIAALKA